MSYYLNTNMTLRYLTHDEMLPFFQAFSGVLAGSGMTRITPALAWNLGPSAGVTAGAAYDTPYSEIYRLEGGAGLAPVYVRIRYRYSVITQNSLSYFHPQIQFQLGSSLNAGQTDLSGIMSQAYSQGLVVGNFTTPAASEFQTLVYMSATPAGFYYQLGMNATNATIPVRVGVTRLSHPSTNALVSDAHFTIVQAGGSMSYNSYAFTAYNAVSTSNLATLSQIMTSDLQFGQPTVNFLYSGDNGLTPDGLNTVSAGPVISMTGRCWSMQNPDSVWLTMPATAGPTYNPGTIGAQTYYSLPASTSSSFTSMYGATGHNLWVRR